MKRIVILTGAGVSAESGIPTFRDAGTGLWDEYPEEAKEVFPHEETITVTKYY